MQINKIVVGELETNCYILTKDNKCLIIDPGDEAANIINEINCDVIGIIITHYHFDHIGALNELKEKYNVPIIDYQNKKILAPFNYQIINTKGHTSDSITIYFEDEKIMFCGDFIFKGTIGRTDLPTGNMEEIKNSIKQLLTFDENIKLFPGHYDFTSIKEEKENLKFILNYY